MKRTKQFFQTYEHQTRAIAFIALFVALLFSSQTTNACTNFIVGKNASVDGSVICTYNADDYGPVSYTHLTLPTTPYV